MEDNSGKSEQFNEEDGEDNDGEATVEEETCDEIGDGGNGDEDSEGEKEMKTEDDIQSEENGQEGLGNSDTLSASRASGTVWNDY